MADRRMFAKAIIESDDFMDMPDEAQMLYIRLNMAADDDGFCDKPKAIMRSCGASDDSMKLLIAKKFVLAFPSRPSVIVIKHWKLNNYIRGDRKHETKYMELMQELYFDENDSYSQNPLDGHRPCLNDIDNQLPTNCLPVDNQLPTNCLPVDNQLPTNCLPVDNQLPTNFANTRSTEVRLGKDSIVEDSLGKANIGQDKTVTPPSVKKKDVEAVVDAWNSHQLKPTVFGIPDPESDEGSGLKEILLKYPVDAVIKAVDQLSRSSFLTGGGDRGWRASFKWFCNLENFRKIISGQYDDSKPVKKQQEGHADDDFDPNGIDHVVISV